jgi:hypothetical protein
MTSDTDISALYREFTDALTEVLAENAVGPARRGRLARARAAVKKHPCPFRKFHPAQIRIVRQNHRIIESDVCNPARARNVCSRPVQVANPA